MTLLGLAWIGSAWASFPATAEPIPTGTTPVATAAPEDRRPVRVRAMIDSGVAFLKSRQKPDGSWTEAGEPPAITALALRALVKELGNADPAVRRGYENLLSFQVEDGGIYRDLLANYNTAIALSTLTAANDPSLKPNIDRATAFLKGLQWTPDTRPQFVDEKEANTDKQVVQGIDDPYYGGFGYGGRSRGAGRPDLSNLHIALEALHDAGVDPADPVFQRALVFLSRTQNFSETNDQPWAGNDGGFIYGPSADRRGESFAGEFVDDAGERRLRSYGSMTYAGLKSFIYAGLTKDDPRVRAAFAWVSDNFTVTENPGMKFAGPDKAQDGLYYYFHTLARTLNVVDEPTLKTGDGTSVDWRTALINKLESAQADDGSWTGGKKWMENNATLVTAYVVLALQEVREDLMQHH
jgi:squalene-hopene/tetraprenyl-beta-curcumene cyclase